MREVEILLLLSFVLKWKEKEERKPLAHTYQQEKSPPSLVPHGSHRSDTSEVFQGAPEIFRQHHGAKTEFRAVICAGSGGSNSLRSNPFSTTC